jgi:hypothetical protein
VVTPSLRSLPRFLFGRVLSHLTLALVLSRACVPLQVIYHPSKYKTQICSHLLDANRHCTGYGMHCAKVRAVSHALSASMTQPTLIMTAGVV